MLDPVIKHECIWYGTVLRPSSLLVDRRGVLLRIRDKNENWPGIPQPVRSFESMMSELSLRKKEWKMRDLLSNGV